MNPLVIETDIGRDADDLFALLYFIGLGAPIRAVCVTPGDLDQVSIVRSLLFHFNIDAPVLTPKARVSKKSITPFHNWVLEQIESWAGTADGHEESLPTEPVDVFVCGPAKMAHLLKPSRITFQGGFVPYSQHRPEKTLDKFEGKEACATFNLGGTKPSVHKELIAAQAPHRWVGKNVCHTIVYTPDIHKKFCPTEQMSEATRLHKLFVEKYMGDKGAKAFHDPLAAILHYNPDIGVWKKLKPERINGEWTAIPDASGSHESLVDLVDRSTQPWERYFEGLQGVRR